MEQKNRNTTLSSDHSK